MYGRLLDMFRKLIALRDEFMCGLQDSRIQQELLCVRDLTLEQALDKARSIEIACVKRDSESSAAKQECRGL